MNTKATPTQKHWEEIAQTQLQGRTITKVRYMSVKLAEEQFGWCERGLILTLDDGNQLIVSADDEGNGPGSLFTLDPVHNILPVIR